MKAKVLAVGIVIALLTVSASLSAPSAAFARSDLTRQQPAVPWTYLIYMAGDNNLESEEGYSLGLLQSGLASGAQANVLVLEAHLNANADLLKVTSGGIITLSTSIASLPAFSGVYGGNRPDMANPTTLSAFFSWGVQTSPSNHYLVDIWSHGGGWKYIIYDQVYDDRMSIADLSTAMAKAMPNGARFDITVFDACLMSMVEVADQLQGVTQYMLGSEESVPAQGFPLDLMLQDLAQSPDIATGAYADEIVDDYYAHYARSNAKTALSVTAVDESSGTLTPLVTAIDVLSQDLIEDMPQYAAAVGNARSVAQRQAWGINGVFWYIDLINFADQIATNIPALAPDARAVASLAKATLYERHSQKFDGVVFGLGINFPPNLTKYNDNNYLAENYAGINLVFTAQTHWDEMLLAYYPYQK